MKVLDASMALAWLFPRQDPAEAALADQALDELDYEEFAVPAIWYGEVANVTPSWRTEGPSHAFSNHRIPR